MFGKMVSLLPVESLVAISLKDSGGDKLRERKSLNFKNERKIRARLPPWPVRRGECKIEKTGGARDETKLSESVGWSHVSLSERYPWDDQQDSCGVKKISGSSGLIGCSGEWSSEEKGQDSAQHHQPGEGGWVFHDWGKETVKEDRMIEDGIWLTIGYLLDIGWISVGYRLDIGWISGINESQILVNFSKMSFKYRSDFGQISVRFGQK